MRANLRYRSVNAKTRDANGFRSSTSGHRPSCDLLDGDRCGGVELWTGVSGRDTGRLAELVDALGEDDDLYHAAIDIAAMLYDGTEEPERVIRAVIDAISKRFF